MSQIFQNVLSKQVLWNFLWWVSRYGEFSEDESNKLLAEGPRGHELHFCKTELVEDHWTTSV